MQQGLVKRGRCLSNPILDELPAEVLEDLAEGKDGVDLKDRGKGLRKQTVIND